MSPDNLVLAAWILLAIVAGGLLGLSGRVALAAIAGAAIGAVGDSIRSVMILSSLTALPEEANMAIGIAGGTVIGLGIGLPIGLVAGALAWRFSPRRAR